MKYLNKTIEYGLYLLAFILPLGTRWIIRAGELEYTTYSLYGTDILLILLLAMFVVCEISRVKPGAKGALALLAMTEKKPVARNDRKVFLLIGGLLVVSFTSVFFAADKTLAVYKFGWLVLGAGLFRLIARAEYDRAKLVWSLLMGLALESLLAIWQFLAQQTLASKWLGMSLHRASDLGASVIETVGADGAGERWLRAYGGFDQPNILGGALTIGVLLLVGEMIRRDKFLIFNLSLRSGRVFQTIGRVLLIIFSAALFFSFSRGAWLALGAGLAVMMGAAIMKKNLPAQKNILQAVLISGLIFFILLVQFPNLAMTRLYGGGRLENKSASERLASVKNSWLVIKKNWVIGAGSGNYTLALERELPKQENYFYQPAHNVYLLVWSEAGIVGLLFFIGVIIFSFVRLLRRPEYGAPRNDSGAAILISLIVLLSFDHWLWSLHFGVLFFWLAMGLVIKKEKSSGLLLGADLGAEKENRVTAQE